MNKTYVVKYDVEDRTAYQIGNSRVSLDSVVCSWQQGDSAETIADNFPSLTLEEVYGAIAFYLANREMIDEYLRQGEVQAIADGDLWRNGNELHRKLLLIREERRNQVAG